MLPALIRYSKYLSLSNHFTKAKKRNLSQVKRTPKRLTGQTPKKGARMPLAARKGKKRLNSNSLKGRVTPFKGPKAIERFSYLSLILGQQQSLDSSIGISYLGELFEYTTTTKAGESGTLIDTGNTATKAASREVGEYLEIAGKRLLARFAHIPGAPSYGLRDRRRGVCKKRFDILIPTNQESVPGTEYG